MTSKKALVFGGNGQVGRALAKQCPDEWELVALTRSECDVSDEDQLRDCILSARPDAIINASAYTAVDKAETDAKNAWSINANAPHQMARLAVEYDARFLHFSTDFVFSGATNRPYAVDEIAEPTGVYGQTKLEGERAVFESNPSASIVRTSWVYGSHGNNFVKTMLKLMLQRDELGVVCDQIGSPSNASGIAMCAWRLLEIDVRGLFHWSDKGVASWYDFAVAIRDEALYRWPTLKLAVVKPIFTIDYPTPAKRPSFSALDCRQTPEYEAYAVHWRHALRAQLNEHYLPN